MPNLIAVSGAHGTGKTMTALKIAGELSAAHPEKRIGLLAELASECPFPINKESSQDAQVWLFSRQISREIEMMGFYDLVVCDRSCVDVIAYTAVLGWDVAALSMRRMAAAHLHHYSRIIFKTIINNPYWYHNGRREVSDRKFRDDVEAEMMGVYRALGVECVEWI
jgi:predicted ATPase